MALIKVDFSSSEILNLFHYWEKINKDETFLYNIKIWSKQEEELLQEKPYKQDS